MSKLSDMRKAKGLTQVELADKVGVEQSYVAKVEAKRPAPNWLAKKLAKVLKCDVADLFKPYTTDTRWIAK